MGKTVGSRPSQKMKNRLREANVTGRLTLGGGSLPPSTSCGVEEVQGQAQKKIKAMSID